LALLLLLSFRVIVRPIMHPAHTGLAQQALRAAAPGTTAQEALSKRGLIVESMRARAPTASQSAATPELWVDYEEEQGQGICIGDLIWTLIFYCGQGFCLWQTVEIEFPSKLLVFQIINYVIAR
jgi:hypothetical protein